MASDPQTWEELKACLAANMIRDDLEDIIPEKIAVTERWFQREIFSPEREVSVTLTITNGVATLPTGFGGVRTVYVDGTRDTVLDQVSPSDLRTRFPGTDTGTPLVFAIEGLTMLFGPIPSTGMVVKLKYFEGILPLGESQATNWLLTDHPDLYIHAGLAELHEYVRDYAAADRHRAIAGATANSVGQYARRRRSNSGPLVAKARNTDSMLSYLP
jgi:hypothetical protein